MRWRFFVDTTPRNGAENMAIDNALLQHAEEGIGSLRLYRWAPACLSFGRNEPALVRYDRQLIEKLGLPTVRRPTGGRAVWHDSEVTYAVAAPTVYFGTLKESYQNIHRVLASAINTFGLNATLAPTIRGKTPAVGSGACFASPVGGEVVVGDRKLIGSAQVREGGAFLQHGSILIEDGQDIVQQVTVGSTSSLQNTSLTKELNRPVTFNEVAIAISREAKLQWPGSWEDETDSPSGVSRDKFMDPGWTWRR